MNQKFYWECCYALSSPLPSSLSNSFLSLGSFFISICHSSMFHLLLPFHLIIPYMHQQTKVSSLHSSTNMFNTYMKSGSEWDPKSCLAEPSERSHHLLSFGKCPRVFERERVRDRDAFKGPLFQLWQVWDAVIGMSPKGYVKSSNMKWLSIHLFTVWWIYTFGIEPSV